MRDHILGTLYGMALGDAMGMPSELWSRRKIREFFGGKITDFLDSPPENPAAIGLKRGEFTDDTAQALVILDSLMENDYVPDKERIAKNLIDWAVKTDAFDKNILGQSSKAALHAIQAQTDPEIYTIKAVTNGAAMRIAPIGCLFPSSEKEALIDYVFRISEVTHKTDVAIAGAAMIAGAVSAAVEDKSWEEILDTVFSIYPLAVKYGHETYSASLGARLELAIRLADRYKGDEPGFTQSVYDLIGTTTLTSEAVPTAIAMAYFNRQPKECSISCANLGGDTDTIGAMAVAICGAKVGIEKFEPNLIKTLNESNDVDFTKYADSLLQHRGTNQ